MPLDMDTIGYFLYMEEQEQEYNIRSRSKVFEEEDEAAQEIAETRADRE